MSCPECEGGKFRDGDKFCDSCMEKAYSQNAPPKMHKWTVEIEVSDTWVADGFDLDDDRLHNIMMKSLAWAHGHEVKCKVISHPADEDMATSQGYPSVAEYRGERLARTGKSKA